MSGQEKENDVPIYIALDVADAKHAIEWVDRLGPEATHYKVGLQLFVSAGPAILAYLHEQGKRVFLDLKFHDIPNTVEMAVRQAAHHGVDLCTVHALAGAEALKRAVAAAQDVGAVLSGESAMKVLAVTLLTSVDDGTARQMGLAERSLTEHVLRLAELAQQAGAHGVVCSAAELAQVKAAYPYLRALVPGIRPPGAPANDQARVATPAQAVLLGANYLVIGRPITAAPDPRAALRNIRAQLREV